MKIASAAVLAQASVPLVAFLRVTVSMKSMLISASNAVLVQEYALSALLTLQNNLSVKKVCVPCKAFVGCGTHLFIT